MPSGLTKEHLTSVLTQSNYQDHDAILSAANAALKVSNIDLRAQHVRVIALLKLDRFEEALRGFQNSQSKLKDQALLQYAYALYKIGRFAEAEQAASTGQGCRGLRHVLAQTTYRVENFERAASIYQELTECFGEAPEEQSDLLINKCAVNAQLQWSLHEPSTLQGRAAKDNIQTFETAYNAACESLGRTELGRAESLLNSALDLCDSLEELSEAEKRSETASIMIQLGYTSLRQGQVENAKERLARIDITGIFDATTNQVAWVNRIAAFANNYDAYLLHRLFHSPFRPNAKEFFAYQTSVLHRNGISVDLLAMKYRGAARSIADSRKSHLGASVARDIPMISVLNAAAHVRTWSESTGLKRLLALQKRQPQDVGLLLTLIQMLSLANNHASALLLLKAFLKHSDTSTPSLDVGIRHAPALVAVLIALCKRQGQDSLARSYLKEFASHWLRQPKIPAPTSLLRAAALILLESSNSADCVVAGELFCVLREKYPEDNVNAVGAVAADALAASIASTTNQTNHPEPISRYANGVDVEALEKAGVAPYAAALHKPANAKLPKWRATKDGHCERDLKPKRARASRLPKAHDLSRNPDPERWMQLRDRSTYRPRGKRVKNRAAGGVQGGLVPDGPTGTERQSGSTGGKAAPKKKTKKGKTAKW